MNLPRKKTTRYLALNVFFWKKGFKNTFRLLFNSILRFRFPEWKVDIRNTAL